MRVPRTQRACWLLLVVGAAVAPRVAVAAALDEPRDLLPDLIARQADLLDRVQQTVGTPPNTSTLLRVSNSGANIGDGVMQVEGILPANPDGSEDVLQRIYRSDGSNYTRFAGRFTYHPGHKHFHLDNWAMFRICAIAADGGVGPTLRSGRKASYCLLDSAAYDLSIPGASAAARYLTCNTLLQGISVGWMDTYGKNLPGQDIDITGLPDGDYWLETEIDPDNVLLEKDETNNAARVRITINNANGTRLPPDAFEPNNALADVRGMPVDTLNSSNLGPCSPERVVDALTIHDANDVDVFRFYSAATGTANDSVRIEFIHSAGDLNLQLFDDTDTLVATSSGLSNIESISLAGRPRGWYSARVTGFSGARSPYYRVVIDPPAAPAPSVQMLFPDAGDHQYIHGIDAVLLRWSASDPTDNPTWVTLWFNAVPERDGNEISVETVRLVPGAQSCAVLNSAHIPPGTWWVYAEITNGGGTSGSWSDGTITLLDEHCDADLNHDGVVNATDLDTFLAAFAEGDVISDINQDDFITFEDFDDFIEHLEAGC
ncbi:MAG: lysyl oxidase family protein [Planctomycetota bacterium]|nr:lysyl oxidase family protein [Planctomycetota bacterium]